MRKKSERHILSRRSFGICQALRKIGRALVHGQFDRSPSDEDRSQCNRWALGAGKLLARLFNTTLQHSIALGDGLIEVWQLEPGAKPQKLGVSYDPTSKPPARRAASCR
jgi:hypothetical protein